MYTKITKRLMEEVSELDKYLVKNEKNIKKLKEEYERAVNINKRFEDRIKAIKKEIFDLERGMHDIRVVHETCTTYVWCMKHTLHNLMTKNVL